jgi:hypothetical protein
MRLSDIMSRLDLAVYPEVALVLFLGVFAAVMIRVYGRSRSQEMSRAASMPLEDPPTTVNGSKP